MPEMFIKHNITVPSLTLNIDELRKFKLILDKTGNSPTFNIETNNEELTFNDFQSIAGERWPANIKRLTFDTGYSGRRITGKIYTYNIYGLSNIELVDNDRDWISARTDELNRFFDQHRNIHFLFQNIKYVVAQALALVVLLLYPLIKYFISQDWGVFISIPLMATLYGTWYLYGSILPKVFPFLVLEPEHPSFSTRLRNVLKYLILAIFAGLLTQFILSFFP